MDALYASKAAAAAASEAAGAAADAGAGSDPDALSPSDLEQLPYTEAVFKEALRLFPPGGRLLLLVGGDCCSVLSGMACHEHARHMLACSQGMLRHIHLRTGHVIHTDARACCRCQGCSVRIAGTMLIGAALEIVLAPRLVGGLGAEGPQLS